MLPIVLSLEDENLTFRRVCRSQTANLVLTIAKGDVQFILLLLMLFIVCDNVQSSARRTNVHRDDGIANRGRFSRKQQQLQAPRGRLCFAEKRFSAFEM